APAGVRMTGVARITPRRDARSRHVDASGTVRGRQPGVAPVVAAVVPVVAASILRRGDTLARPVAAVRRADDPVAVLAAGSRRPAEARQSVLEGSYASAGHPALDPVQFSATSHAPAEARHTVLEGL